MSSAPGQQGTLFPEKPKRRRKAKAPVALEEMLAEVALPVPMRQTFHYLVPVDEGPRVRVGARVRVPFGGQRLVGVCVARVPREDAGVAAGRLKPIERALDDHPTFLPPLLELARFVADYYRVGLGEALAAALPAGVKKRLRRRRGAAGREAPGDEPAPPRPDAALAPPGDINLTDGQRAAVDLAAEDLRARRFGVTLIHGITGSGKTEAYLRLCEEALRGGRRVLVLVPEIALTPQTVRRFTSRLGPISVLHSMQSPKERAASWEAARRGKVPAVVGPRSAIFAPLPDLGLIVVDEEHDPGFKQGEQSPRYSARDLAVVRARLEGAACVLGSATPSLESLENARRGRYRMAVLAERPGGARLPSVEVVDLREEAKAVKGFPFISRLLERHMRAALDRREQVILFLNRRGFATFLNCPACSHVLTCGQCDVALTFHKERREAMCHACERTSAPPTTCPVCRHGAIRYFGVGTQKVEEEVRRRFPDAVVRRIDSDAAPDGDELEVRLDAFAKGEVQVLIGTQMVAKGLDFPGVTVVGVVSADTGLNLPDFRASERTFQLTAQVAGRAGRGDRPGVTVIQTFSPGHPAIRFATAHDVTGFTEQELEHRRRLGYPPFGRLIRVVASSEDERLAFRTAEEAAGAARAASDERARILGPAPCPLSRVRGRFRVMLLVKAADRGALQPALAALEALPRPAADARLAIDIDPVSML